MSVPGTLAIGAYTFDVPEGQHTVEEQPIGPTGELNFAMDDWAGGMLTIQDGLNYQQNQPKYLSAKGADAAFPGQVILQPQATTVSVASGQTALSLPWDQIDFVPSGGSLNTFMVTANGIVYDLNSSKAWTAVASTASGGSFDLTVQGSQIGVAYGTAYKYASDPAGSWTNVATAADRFGIINNKLWRAVRPNSLYSTTSFAGSWTSAYTVADSSYSINSISSLEQVLMIGKDDGIYSVDVDGVVVPFTPELRLIANANFADIRASAVWNNDFYFRTLNGVVRIAGSDGGKDRVGLDTLSSPDLPAVQVQAMASDDRYLYALCNNSSNDLMILRRSLLEAWHVFYWDGSGGTKVGKHLSVSAGLGYPALFFSYSDGATTYTTKAIRLSTFPNAIQDSNYRYDTSANLWIRLPRMGTPAAKGLIDRIQIQGRNLTANVNITPYVSVDGGAITQFGTVAATTSPQTILPTTAVAGNFFDVYLYLVTNDATTTPILTGIVVSGTFTPDFRRYHHFSIPADLYHRTARGGRLREDPQLTVDNLNTLKKTNLYQACVDEAGRSFSAKIISTQWAMTRLSEHEEPTQIIKVTLLEKAS